MEIDGVISYSSLRALKKDEKWLYNQLNVTTQADLENILLAIYDQEEDTMNISKKNN